MTSYGKSMFSSLCKISREKNIFRIADRPNACFCTYADGYGNYKEQKSLKNRKVVLVEGVRSPFVHSFTYYRDMPSYYLQRHALLSLMRRIGIPKEVIEYVVVGQVNRDINTTNVAREAALSAGFPENIPNHSVVQACISACQAITTGCNMLIAGQCDILIAGGVEILSDVPIQLHRTLRRMLYEAFREKTISKKLQAFKDLRPRNISLEYPSVYEFASGEHVGHFADRLSAAFKVSRREQDEFAVRSHTFAKKASDDGLLDDVQPFIMPGNDTPLMEDQGIRASTVTDLEQLKPSFISPHGTVTAGNSTFLTDGSSACLLATEEKAISLGLKPKAYLRDFVYISVDPKDQLLLGPAYAVPKVLDKVGLTMKDIDVFEYHEAFAGQILANIKAMDSDWFSQNYIGSKEKVGFTPMDKLNLWGGSLSLGHPFGATGVRLITTAAKRLDKEDGQFALVAACAGGGIGHAMIMERCPT